METGPKISAIFHGAAILLAAVGGPLFDSEPDDSLRVSEVSLISGAELASLLPSAPEPNVQPTLPTPELPEATEPTPNPVQPSEPKSDAPEVPEPDQPETPIVETQPEVQPEVVEPAETQGTTDLEGVGQIAQEDNAGEITPDRLAAVQPKPRPADRIADKVSKANEPEPAEVKQETEPPTQSEEPAPEKPNKVEPAQEEATTEIVTEADKQEETTAPVKSIRPKGRPLNVAKKVQDLVEQEKKIQEEIKAAEAKAIEEQVAQDIAAAIAAATEEGETTQAAGETASSGSSVSGSPLTQSEREGLIFKVQQCWNVPVAIQNASELKVTLRVFLDPDGHLKSSPELIDPINSGLVGVQHAYEAGRRALIRCQPFKLPADKYETWKEIEIVFNPQKMVLK